MKKKIQTNKKQELNKSNEAKYKKTTEKVQAKMTKIVTKLEKTTQTWVQWD